MHIHLYHTGSSISLCRISYPALLILIWIALVSNQVALCGQRTLLRQWGVEVGIFHTGPQNAIIDVPGVMVGHSTLIKGHHVRTGVTAVLPHQGNLFEAKVPAAIFVGNGFGKLAGSTQVEELGFIETPIILTNTLSVGTAITATVMYTLAQDSSKSIRSVNAIVGETNDGFINDIRGLHVNTSDVLAAISKASRTNVEEGNVGAGTGTMSFGFKAGIGTSSRRLPQDLGGYTVGVLVQANFGGVLEIAGVPIGKLMGRYPFKEAILSGDGSCMIIIATDAPLNSSGLKRLAKRAMLGFAKTGGMSSNGSGDYVIAFCTDHSLGEVVTGAQVMRNDKLSPLFQATIEATEEAIINALLAAEDMTGYNGHTASAIDKDLLKSLLEQHHVIQD